MATKGAELADCVVLHGAGLAGLTAKSTGRASGPSAASAGHRATLVGAAPARDGALLAVVHRVLRALFAARLADVGAEPAQRAGELAAACHVAGGQPADRSAIHVERDASRHRLHVRLLQTGGGAMVAGDGAGVAAFGASIGAQPRHERKHRDGGGVG